MEINNGIIRIRKNGVGIAYDLGVRDLVIGPKEILYSLDETTFQVLNSMINRPGDDRHQKGNSASDPFADLKGSFVLVAKLRDDTGLPFTRSGGNITKLLRFFSFAYEAHHFYLGTSVDKLTNTGVSEKHLYALICFDLPKGVSFPRQDAGIRLLLEFLG